MKERTVSSVRHKVNKLIRKGKFNVIKVPKDSNNKIIQANGGLSKNKRILSKYYVEQSDNGIILYDIDEHRLTLYINNV